MLMSREKGESEMVAAMPEHYNTMVQLAGVQKANWKFVLVWRTDYIHEIRITEARNGIECGSLDAAATAAACTHGVWPGVCGGGSTREKREWVSDDGGSLEKRKIVTELFAMYLPTASQNGKEERGIDKDRRRWYYAC